MIKPAHFDECAPIPSLEKGLNAFLRCQKKRFEVAQSKTQSNERNASENLRNPHNHCHLPCTGCCKESTSTFTPYQICKLHFRSSNLQTTLPLIKCKQCKEHFNPHLLTLINMSRSLHHKSRLGAPRPLLHIQPQLATSSALPIQVSTVA